jgi:3-phenylpropionate/trans-cinnamate dioxygenase ferredoxin reductase component
MTPISCWWASACMPNDELATHAGLASMTALSWTTMAWTGDPAIFAAGDCTRHVGREGTSIRLECVQNAIDQAKHCALAMVGKPKTYSEVPWFWSDQFDLKLQIAGMARPTDRIVLRGDPGARKFAVFHLRDGAVAAVEAVNAARIHDRQEADRGRRAIARKAGRHRHSDEATWPDGPKSPSSKA